MTTIRSLLQRLAELFSRDPSAALRDLDARTLADIGVDRSEIASIEAEWRGRAHVSRLHIAGRSQHA